MAAEDKKPALVEATVAHGRTLQIGAEQKGAGEKVNLDADEVRRLRKLGFLVDPKAKEEPARGNGPSFSADGGVKVQKVA